MDNARAGALVVLAVSMLACEGPAAPFLRADTRGCTSRTLVIVAHPDDDLLFVDPDVSRAIVAGSCVAVLYITAGDDGRDAEYWTRREYGVQAAYAQMIGAADDWVSSYARYARRHIAAVRAASAPVWLAFLRFPDGIDGHGSEAHRGQSLAALWRDPTLRIATLDDEGALTRAALLDFLEAMMRDVAPTEVLTLDRTGAYGADHSDHRNTARFVLRASERVERDEPVQLTMYRGYNITDEPENLDAKASADKRSFFSSYVVYDDALGDGHAAVVNDTYAFWYSRRYPLPATADIAGSLVAPSGSCLSAADGLPIRVASCDERPAQSWVHDAAGRLRTQGGCLSASPTDARVALAPCEDVAAQRWTQTDANQLSALGRCLALDAFTGTLQTAECADVSEQRWTLTS